jgi:hypothetical protein
MTYCTSVNCPYKNNCSRQTKDETDDVEDAYYNFEYCGCDADNGFADYIKR